MIVSPDLTAAGVLLKTHGIHGELVAGIDGDGYEPEAGQFIFVAVDGLEVPYRIDSLRPRGSESCLLTLAGVDTDTVASALAGKTFSVESSLLSVDDDEPADGFYIDDLIGYSLVADGRLIGVVDDYDDSTDNVLFKVLAPDGRVLLVPAVAEMIDDVDPDTHTLVMSLPDGLLDL